MVLPASRIARGRERTFTDPLMRAFIGLGSNLGDRDATIERAVELLGAAPGVRILAVSSLRETEPWGYADQPEFLNGAVEVDTELLPRGLLAVLNRIEDELGRVRDPAQQYAPRTLDLDLLLYGEGTVDEPDLTVPHPRLARAGLRAGAAGRDRSRRSRCPTGHGSRTSSGLWWTRARIRAMSHLDELDEFEADLELRLKKEYTAVFGLFRYCVVTQDSTYLCNRLDVKVLPQSTYPFFHVTMEDVWVWDKNRPTRMIPKAEVYTSSDVTIEELRGEGEEPTITAEALAERLGETPTTDDE